MRVRACEKTRSNSNVCLLISKVSKVEVRKKRGKRKTVRYMSPRVREKNTEAVRFIPQYYKGEGLKGLRKRAEDCRRGRGEQRVAKE